MSGTGGDKDVVVGAVAFGPLGVVSQTLPTTWVGLSPALDVRIDGWAAVQARYAEMERELAAIRAALGPALPAHETPAGAIRNLRQLAEANVALIKILGEREKEAVQVIQHAAVWLPAGAYRDQVVGWLSKAVPTAPAETPRG